MAARGHEDLPEIEVVGVPGEAPDMVRVTTGIGPRRRRDLLVLAVAAAAVAVGVAVSVADGDGTDVATPPTTGPTEPPPSTVDTQRRPRSTTSSPRPTTTRPIATTAPPADVGPLVPGGDGVRMALSYERRVPVFVDVGTGRMAPFERRSGMSSMIGVRDGIVGVRGEVAEHLRADGTTVELGPAHHVAPAGSARDRVWLFHAEFEPSSDEPPEDTITLVGLDGAVRLGPLRLPPHNIVLGDRTGVVFSHVGGAYRADETGIRRIDGLSNILAVTDQRFLGTHCDEAGICRLAVVDRRTGELSGLDGVAEEASADLLAPLYFGYYDGGVGGVSGERVAIPHYTADSPAVTVFDLERRSLRTYEIPGSLHAFRVVWLPRDLGMVLLTQEMNVARLDLATGELERFPPELAPLDDQIVVLGGP